ncbi:phosphatase PAP2 family protein [Noviherbaspirillum massiliense]|uniref:phosphatase PAP2 family protein n=1 Tax=Noviherbaspirillum massiliense TaxID=1465823 RepID=UPI000380E093|nr:phosphatase PAP2 family protein [Noviherbaspirillum massiliense]
MTNRHFLITLVILFAMAAVLVWIGRYTNVDLYLADAVFDFGARKFPRRDQWFYQNFMHHMASGLLIGAGLVLVAMLLIDRAVKGKLLEVRTRRALMVVLGSAVLIPLTVSTMKLLSIHHCPWSMERYGGFAPYLRIFDTLPAGAAAGRCFPAAHASGGLWVAAVAAFWLPEKPLKALAAFVVGLTPGIALGLSQQMRGAHFLTHTLWSIWIAAFIILILIKVFIFSTKKELAVRKTILANQHNNF